MTERQTVKIDLVSRSIFGSIIDQSKYEDDRLVEVIFYLNELLASIPEEYKTSAKVSVNASTYYDSIDAELSIYYERPETDNEMDVRISRERSSLEEEARRHGMYAAQARARLAGLK